MQYLKIVIYLLWRVLSKSLLRVQNKKLNLISLWKYVLLNSLVEKKGVLK